MDKSKNEIYGVLGAYLLFVIPPILSLALQYEVSKDRMFFIKFINSNTENLKMDDYLRISFLLFYHLGAYTGVELRKILLKKNYRKTDMVHLELIGEIIKRKKILLAILMVQLIMIIALFSSYFFIK
ncbi:hypothetical protein DABAL43B_1107 [Psychrobacter sp. DAB_AL43B]|nr:hypothetical protein DABAL43B_1107 [Psychrobacter sp. DAB_AL43B]